MKQTQEEFESVRNANAKQLEGKCENSGKGLSICHTD